MTTDLAVRRANGAIQAPSNTMDLLQLGEVLAKSGYFANTTDQAKAVVKILAGQELGFGAVASMSGLHIVDGKPVIAAGMMATALKRSNKYDYKIVRLDNEGCVLDIFQQGQKVGQSAFVKEDAQAAELLGKQNWKRYPRNMYFARAISNAVKFFAGDVFDGAVYTPDELGMEVNDAGEAINEGVYVEVKPPEDAEASQVESPMDEPVATQGQSNTAEEEDFDPRAELEMLEAFEKGNPKEYWDGLAQIAEQMGVNFVHPAQDANDLTYERYSMKLLKRIWERLAETAPATV